MQVSKCCDQCALFAALFRVFFSCVLFGVFCGFGFGVFSCVVSCALMDFRLPSLKGRILRWPALKTEKEIAGKRAKSVAPSPPHHPDPPQPV